METTASRLMPHLWKSTLVSGVLALVLGVLILAWPGRTILAAAVLFGVYLLITGIAQTFFAFSLPIMSARGRVLLFLSGTASVILAVLCFRHFNSDEESIAVLLLAIWIGIGFIFRGVAEAASAISEPGTPGRGWQIFLGIITLLAGIIVMAAPITSLATLTLVVGIWLIILGVMEIVASFGIRKAGTEVRTAVGEALAAR